MFAVLKTGGKQYKVSANDVLTVEKLAGDAGDTVQFDEILMLGGDQVTVGTPLVKGASVRAEVLEQMLGPKVVSYKKRRRKHSSQRKRGHRQQLTRVRITDIRAQGEGRQGRGGRAGRGGSRRGELKERAQWHIRKQAARPATVAIPPGGGSA